MKKSRGKGTVYARFRNINIAIFLISSMLIGAVMFSMIKNIADNVAKDYARFYSSDTVGTLNTYLRGEIALIKKAARSAAVTGWFADEDNQEKKLAAHEEMMGIIDVLAGRNLYLGIEKSLHEFTVEENFSPDDIKPYATLAPDYFDDAWYFECAAADKEYLLNVDVDKMLHRKRVWLNYKVTDNGDTLGVIATGLEFSSLVEELFSKYGDKNVRGLVIDEKGVIHMDSDLLGDENFLNYSIGDERHIEEEFTDAALLSAVDEHIGAIDGYFDSSSDTSVVEMKGGAYRYATVAPIASTTWSVVTLYNAASLFSITELLPILFIIFAMFIVFIAVTDFVSAKLIFVPFERLMDSVARIKINMNERVYGTERRDEIGDLANTIQNMRDSLIDALSRLHYDALTGIHNKRFLEKNLDRLIQSMSRSGGLLSVMMIDVDFFKAYNDTYGHYEGDVCLKKIAAALSGSISRVDDFVARYGGEEFAVVLPNTDENGARVMANKLLESIRACGIPLERDGVASRVTVSIGVTTGDAKYTQNEADYIRRADEALYLSKQNGRDRYTFLKFTVN